jgi:hypothetical protein
MREKSQPHQRKADCEVSDTVYYQTVDIGRKVISSNLSQASRVAVALDRVPSVMDRLSTVGAMAVQTWAEAGTTIVIRTTDKWMAA